MGRFWNSGRELQAFSKDYSPDPVHKKTGSDLPRHKNIHNPYLPCIKKRFIRNINLLSLQSVRVHLFSMKMASFNISFHVYIDIHPVVIIMIQIQDDIESKVQITFAKAHWGRIHILYFTM